MLLIAAIFLGLRVLAQSPAEVLDFSGTYEMKSPTEARYVVRHRILVNDQAGLPAAVFAEYTDEFVSLESFSGSITTGGKVVKKLRKQDVVTLAADIFVKKDIRLGEKSLINVGLHGLYHNGYSKMSDGKYTEASSSVIRKIVTLS